MQRIELSCKLRLSAAFQNEKAFLVVVQRRGAEAVAVVRADTCAAAVRRRYEKCGRIDCAHIQMQLLFRCDLHVYSSRKP